MNDVAETNGMSHPKNWAWLSAQLALMAAVFATGWFCPGSQETWLRQPIPGLALVFISAVIGLAGCVALRSSLSAFPEPRRKHLITTGIYRWMRHPMYAGLLVLALGWVLWTGSIAALVVGFLLWWLLRRKAALEDRMLDQIYPEHADYAARTWCFFSGKSRK